jgi:RNA polymerase sigma-70 factor (ECF subfamily)
MKAIYKTYTDEELAVMLNERDMSAYEEIYIRYWHKLYYHAHNMLDDEDQAEDIVQDLFASILNKMGKVTYQSNFVSYLFVSVRNAVLDVFKHQVHRKLYAEDFTAFNKNGAYTIDNYIRTKELEEQINKEIASLPPKMREVFELSRKAFLNHQEIAEKMGSTPGTVKKTISNAIVKLRSRLSCLVLLQVMATILWLNRS